MRRHKASIRLQAAIRSWLCKKSFLEKKAASVRFQCGWRVRCAKKRLYTLRSISLRLYPIQHPSVVALFCFGVNRLMASIFSRSRYNTRRDSAATRIQARQRCLVKQRDFQKLKRSVVVCQREARRTDSGQSIDMHLSSKSCNLPLFWGRLMRSSLPRSGHQQVLALLMGRWMRSIDGSVAEIY